MKSAVRSIRFFKNNAAKSRPSQGSDTMYVPGLNFKCFSFDVMSQSVFNSSLFHFKVTSFISSFVPVSKPCLP